MEIWKAVEGYEGLYEVSNLGRVRGLDRFVRHSGEYQRKAKGIVLKEATNSTGHYSTVKLNKNGVSKQHKVHRLVALAFIENPNGYKEINHKDENKQNNCVENLEWCTRKYNENYGTKRERWSRNIDRESQARKVSKAVYQVSPDGNIVKRWDSIVQIHKELGYSSGNISMCCNGKIKRVYGFLWRFA